MIGAEEFQSRCERSIRDSVCVLCGEGVAEADPTAQPIAIGDHADVAVRMCDDCLRGYLIWREQDQRRQAMLP